MANNKISGDLGEKEVIKLVPCPNCKKELMVLPPSFPLFDVQCTGCSFRAQVKTNVSKPKKEIFGAGWEIMDKVTKSGYIVPPLIVNFKWQEKGIKKQEIRFYPFVPKLILESINFQKKQEELIIGCLDILGLINYLILFFLLDKTFKNFFKVLEFHKCKLLK